MPNPNDPAFWLLDTSCPALVPAANASTLTAGGSCAAGMLVASVSAVTFTVSTTATILPNWAFSFPREDPGEIATLRARIERLEETVRKLKGF